MEQPVRSNADAHLRARTRVSLLPSRRAVILLLAFGLGLVAVLLALLDLHVRRHRESTIRQYGEVQSATAEGAAGQVADWLRERQREAAFINSHEPLRRMALALRARASDAVAAEATFRQVFEWLLASGNYSDIRIVDPRDGAVLLETGETSAAVSPPDADAIADAVRDGSATGRFFRAADGSLRVDLAASIGADSEPTVIVLRIDADDHLLPLIEGMQAMKATGEVLLVERQGDDVVYVSPPSHGAHGPGFMRQPLADRALPAAAVLRGDRGVLEGRDYRGEPVLAAVCPVDGAPWGIVAKTDLSIVDAEARADALSLAATGALGLLLCGVAVGTSLWRQRARERLQAAEEEIRRRDLEERLALVIQSANEVIAMVGEDLRVLDVNDRAVQVYGYSHGEIARMHVRDLWAPSALTDLTPDVVAVDDDEARTFETVHRRKDGTEFPVEVSIRRVRRNERTYYEAIVRDISERRRAEEELATTRAQFLQAQKMEAVGRLAGGVAHDFNNLLTVINGYADLLLRRTQEGAPGRPQLEQIQQAGTRAAGLTRQLLAFSRRQVFQPTILDLNEVVRNLESMLRRLLGENVELSTQEQEEIWAVLTDRGHTEQVLMNLAVNARDAIAGTGRIVIRTANVAAGSVPSLPPDVDFVLVEVVDDGCGMSDEVQQHIFEPFFTTKSEGKGTGLGLATVFGIVSQANGHVRVQSAPGRGTTFQVYMPRARKQQAPNGPTPGARVEPPAPRGTETVLLVEDEPQVRRLAGDALREHGYRVVEAAAPEEALAALSDDTLRPDILVTDVVLPQMDGKALSVRVRRMRPAVAVLFMSGYTGENLTEAGVFEAANFLQKPFTPAELLRKVRETLGARRP